MGFCLVFEGFEGADLAVEVAGVLADQGVTFSLLFSRIGTPDEALYCLHFQRPRVCKDRARDLGDESRTRGVMKPYGGK